MTLYLIAHKVRGEPAFDIATREDVEGEEMWIIPTSGHRAYPYSWAQYEFEKMLPPGFLMPDDLPDHYPIRVAPNPNRLAQLLSLLPKPTRIKSPDRRF
jgi:hypothetical protein